MKKKIFATLVALCVSSLLTTAFAVPAYPGWRTMEQPDGTTIEVRQVGDEFFHSWINRDGQPVTRNEAGYWEVSEAIAPSKDVQLRRQAVNAARRMRAANIRNDAGAGKTDMTKGIIILVNYTDVKFQTANNKAAYTAMMTDDSYSYNKTYPGSAHKYFYDQSNKQYNPQFDVYGPYTLSQNRAYYGANDEDGNDKKPAQMIKDACKLADSDIDFSQYDLDKNGEVDFVYVFYAGNGEADSEEEDAVWPHAWDLSSAGLSLTCDGKKINLYACSSELDGSNERAGIATFCHEFSHVIGMPDYYDINYGDNYENGLTPMEWTLMDGGSYNGDGYCPPNYSIFDKYYMGWAKPTILNSPCEVTMTTGYTDAYQINASGSLAAYNNTGTQYYLENRQQSGWDKALPGHGMLVWKVTYDQTAWDDNGPNATAGTIRYGVLCADGAHTYDKTYQCWYADDGDTYPGTKKVTSINSSAPFKKYAITEIKESSNNISFKFMGGFKEQYTVTWTVDGVSTDTSFYSGDALVLPSTPSDCQSGRKFVGWTAEGTFAGGDKAPADLFSAAGSKTVTANTTYYAVFATETDIDSAPIRKAGKTVDSVYTFTSKSWASVPANRWTSNAAGYAYSSENGGIQFTEGNTNGNATSKTSFSDITKIVVSYCTNAKKGAGTIDITVGNNTKTSLSVTKDGGTTARDLEFSYATPQSGAVTIGASCTTNSIYICGITITSGSGKSYTDYSLTCTQIGTDLETLTDKPRAIKRIENGKFIIEYNGTRYTIMGEVVD